MTNSKQVRIKRLLIIGAGAQGRVILDAVRCQGQIEVAGFIDDNEARAGELVDGISIMGTSLQLKDLNSIGSYFVVGVGDNQIRASLFERAYQAGFAPYTVIHPSAVIADDVVIGLGAVILAGVVINTGSRLGNNVCVNTAASVDHDNTLEDHSHVYPGANLAGGVHLKRFSYVGTGAAINPYITIGENVMVGTGAAVIKNVPDNVTVVGVPAKIIKQGIIR